MSEQGPQTVDSSTAGRPPTLQVVTHSAPTLIGEVPTGNWETPNCSERAIPK